MLRILLADDDILALNRLSGLINWNANGYEVVGQALGGRDCLKLVNKLSPDMLILDIDMPDVNGVQVTKELHRQKSRVKILILSNYDTFGFVRDAMRYGACDYLLKHQLTASILLDKLKETEEILKKEGADSSHMTFFTTVAKQKYLRSLLLNGIVNQEEHSHMSAQKDFSPGCFCLSVMQITNFILITHFSRNMEREKLINSITTLGANIFSSLGNGLITHMEYGQFAVLFHFSEHAGTQEITAQLAAAMRLLSSNIRKVFSLTAIYQLSGSFSRIDSLPACYQKTVAGLEKQAFPASQENKAAVLQKKASDPGNAPAALSVLTLQEEKDLMDALTSLDLPKTESLLETLFHRFQQDKGRLPQSLVSQLLEIGGKFQENQNIVLYKNDVLKADDFSQMKPSDVTQFLLDYFHDMIQRAPGYGSRKYSVHIQKALLFIHQNYAGDISLSMLAEELHVSPTHLSRLFGKEVGTSFIDYLVSYRVQRAQQMILHSNLDLKSIGEQVGFHSYNYFLRAYKEKTGHTPSQDFAGRSV